MQQFEEDGYDEDEVEAELGILRLEGGYLKQLLGQHEAANQMYLSCIKSNPDDITQVAMASNNILVLNRDRDVFDSKKRVKALSDSSLAKLTNAQRHLVHFNLALFALALGQTAQARELIGRLQQGEGQGGGLAALAEVALLCRQGQHSQGVELLSRFVQEQPIAAGPLVVLTLAQLQLAHNSSQSAVQTLAVFPKVRGCPWSGGVCSQGLGQGLGQGVWLAGVVRTSICMIMGSVQSGDVVRRGA